MFFDHTEALIFWAFSKHYIGVVRRSLMAIARVTVK